MTLPAAHKSRPICVPSPSSLTPAVEVHWKARFNLVMS